MRANSSKRILALCIGIVIIATFVWLVSTKEKKPDEVIVTPEKEVVKVVIDPKQSVIGNSVEGRKIESFTFGTGGTNLLMVGGIHGGYEWNSVLLAYEFIDYYTKNPNLIPANLTVTIVPSANPDGVFDVVKKEGRFVAADTQFEDTSTGLGRFNTHGVDLNRNFDCKWKPESTWKGNTVPAGTSAFSEPEAQAIKSVVNSTTPKAVIFFHSQSNAVYASECTKGILPVTRVVMNAYSTASGYKAVDVFDSYEITGDAEGWLASIGIPAITVELETHKTLEWTKNLAGVNAVFNYFKK